MNWAPLLLSFQVATIATAIAAVLGVGIATLLATRRFIGRDLVDVLITAPIVMPPTVLGYYVLVVISKNGPIGQLWQDVFGTRLAFSRNALVIAATIGALPMIVKSARAALEGVDPIYIGAARTLGAGRLRAFFTVMLPLAAPGIVAGCMLGFARALGDFGVTLMIAGNMPGETQTASLAIYDAIQANRSDDAAGMIAVLTSFVIVVLYVVNKLTGRRHG